MMKIAKWIFILLFLIGGRFFIGGIWLIYDEYPNIIPTYMVATNVDSYVTSNGVRTRFYGYLINDQTNKVQLFFSKGMRKEYSNINTTLNQYFIQEKKQIPIWSDSKRGSVRFRLQEESVKPKILSLYWSHFFIAFIFMLPLSIKIYLRG